MHIKKSNSSVKYAPCNLEFFCSCMSNASIHHGGGGGGRGVCP